MGTLKPNTTYIYESPDKGKTVYARKFGSSEKRLVGYVYENPKEMKDIDQLDLWRQIFLAAETNVALKKALDHAKIIYNLSKDQDNDEVFHVRV